ncbi:MAG: hypothetical protein ACOCUP_02855 [bacterium]
MKPILKILTGLLFAGIVFSSCEDMLETESERILLADDHQLNSPNDTIYSMVGIFTKMEKLAKRFVLLGELRGDLMDVTPNASLELQDIYNFNVAENNQYAKKSDYYSVINHCNFLINNIDTAMVVNAKKVMYKEFAAAKAIRAWTYMQLALNHGSVVYYTDPILDVSETEAESSIGMDELAPLLIEDLEPWKNVEEPGSIDLEFSVLTNSSYFPIRYLLGELYLWNGNYEMAATEFHDLIDNGEYTIRDAEEGGYQVWREVENNEFVEDGIYTSHMSAFYPENGRVITSIKGRKEFGRRPRIIKSYRKVI